MAAPRTLKVEGKMEIYLIRHGECTPPCESNYDPNLRAANGPLTARGIRQAHALKQRLAGVSFDAVFSSDLLRAKETARILCEKTGTVPVYSEAFREIDMGLVAYRPWSDFPKEYRKWALHEEDLPYPQGENGEAVARRFFAQLNKFAQNGHSRIAIVCHGGMIRCAVCGVLGLPQQRRFLLGDPVENCSITVVKHNPKTGEYRLQSFNDAAHLAGIF